MPETKEWTLMFYLASDNPLAPGVVTQLKAIKAAGFHPDANVVTQFDPFVEGTPTHIFEVNLINKLQQPGVADVGFTGNDPFVRNLVEDKLWREQKTRNERAVKRELQRILKQNHGLNYDAPTAPEDRLVPQSSPRDDPEEPDPQESLTKFLAFCRNKYPARHYALFLLGHGVVVGNDVFLFDEHASRHSLTLTELGVVLRDFKTEIDDAEFELVSFHSCSVSSVEVAYELQCTANYMLASQGPAFVGSWPYRAILIRIFNDLIREGSHIKVKKMLLRIFQYCFFNSVDFLLAGYSYQLTLINLRKVHRIKYPLELLVNALLAGLDDPVTKDVILLSHLKSQSFFQEMYTDLYDFCFCINNKICEIRKRNCHCPNPCHCPHPCHCTDPSHPNNPCPPNKPPCTCPLPKPMHDLELACLNMRDVLVKENPPRPGGDRKKEQIIVSAEFLGPSYQYSRGLSVYFPWTAPIGDRRILSEYARYKIHQDFEQNHKKSWLDFLRDYFDKTMREVSSQECDHPRRFLPNVCWPPCDPPAPPQQQDWSKQPSPCDQPAFQQPSNQSECCRQQEERELREDIANLILGDGGFFGSYELSGNKIGPKDPTGPDCECASIKNYPRDTRPRRIRTEEAIPAPKTVAEKEKENRVEFTQASFL